MGLGVVGRGGGDAGQVLGVLRHDVRGDAGHGFGVFGRGVGDGCHAFETVLDLAEGEVPTALARSPVTGETVPLRLPSDVEAVTESVLGPTLLRMSALMDATQRNQQTVLRGLRELLKQGQAAPGADQRLDALAALEPRVADDFARRHGRFDGHSMAIVALGKLGSRQMTLRSDLDLIMVYDVPPDLGTSDGEKPLAPNEYFIRLTQRMINAVTAPTGEGRLYDVDMRLRPSGNAGPLAISLESFARYQANDAWTWEHMALTRARVIHGPPGLVERLEAAVRGVLTRPRDPDKLLRDVSEMRARIDKEFGTTDIWDVKYIRGGTIDVEFVAQYLMLRHAAEHPEILSGDAAAALRAAARAGLLDGRVADDLCAALSLWRRIQGFLRLTTEGRFVAEKAPAGLRQALIRAAFPESADDAGFGFDALEAKARGIAARAHRHFVDLVDEPAARLADLG